MSDLYPEWMRAYAEETAPTSAEIDRIHDQLAQLVLDTDGSALLLSRVQGPRPDEVGRVIAGVLEGKRRKTRRPWGLALAASGGLALAMATLLVLGTAGVAVWMLSGEAVVSASLVASDSPVVTEPASGVRLQSTGRGEVSGTASAPRIAWSTGSVTVEVEPEQGIDLVVETREATVRVIGTVFDVNRDALGTSVTVERGKVQVTCHVGGEHMLEAGGEVTCVPTTAAALLGRAVELEERGAVPERVLSTVELALAMQPSEMLSAELRGVRVRALVGLERKQEALDEVAALLDDRSSPRRKELLAVAATLAVNLGDCERARPWIEELAAFGRSPALRALRKECR